MESNWQPLRRCWTKSIQASSARDKNSYTLGRVGAHNIVIAVMPENGNNQAANVAIQLLNDFKSIGFGLLVGIGDGIPVKDDDDIRLGDVVVSKPTTTFGGVVQFDQGKVHTNGRFERTGTLNKPPPVLSANVQKLQAQHKGVENQISKYLEVWNGCAVEVHDRQESRIGRRCHGGNSEKYGMPWIGETLLEGSRAIYEELEYVQHNVQ